MIQSAMTATNMSYTSALATIRLVNIAIGAKKLPESLYHFKKVCIDSLTFTKKFFCKTCLVGIGELLPASKKCPTCQNSITDYFVSIPLKPTLERIVSQNFDNIMTYRTKMSEQPADVISGVNNGMWHRNQQDRENLITLNLNTDGVRPFKQGKKPNLWPLFLTINDLDPIDRFKKRNIISAGYWLSDIQPIVDYFLQPLIDEMNELSNSGMEINGRRFKVIIAACCFDSVARPKILCMKQFNGNYGCTFCLHPGVQQHYPYMQVERRTLVNYLEDVTAWSNLSVAEKNKGLAINGVKGRTILLQLEGFNPMLQVPVDVMHNVFLGVAKTLLDFWFSSDYRSFNFHVGNRQKKVADQRFRRIKIYSECTRKTDTLTDKYSKFKANELHNFFFHYSKYILSYPVLNAEYYQHFLLLVDSIEILCGSKFTITELDICERNLDTFVRQFETLYDEKLMFFNVHLLTHITETARLFGSLMNTSLFPFENMNGVINKFVNAPKAPTLQICVRHHLYISNYYNTMRRIHEDAQIFCRNMMTTSNMKYKFTNDSRKWKLFQLTENIHNPYNNVMEFKSFNKYYYDKTIISTIEQSSKSKLYNDSYILYDDKFYKIHKILKEFNSNDNVFYILGGQISVRTFPSLQNFHEVINTETPALIRIQEQLQKCICIKWNNSKVLVIIKNKLIVD
jgi:hypothetical protein